MHFCLRCYVTERFSEPAAADRRARAKSICVELIAYVYINTHMHTYTRTRAHMRSSRVFAERYERESELESGVERESEAANACVYVH